MPALSTLSSRLRERIPHLSCAIIKSGTSRFVVLREEELPTGRARGKIILDLLANDISTDGVGGKHYQSNKVSVMGPGRGEASFVFHFYQVIPEARRLFSKMECSNAAASSGLAAMLLGVARTNHNRTLKSVNEATNQAVELVPPEGDCWGGDWCVRFTNLHHLWSHMTKSAQPFRFNRSSVRRLYAHGARGISSPRTGHAFDRRWSCGHHMEAHADDSGEAVRVFDEQLRPEAGLKLVLESIVETGATLATGHLGAAEIMALVPMALEIGVSRILLTHPHYPSVELSNDQLAQLNGDSRVFIEHCLAIHTIEGVPLDRFADSILATGTRQVVLATDFGQIHSDPVPDGSVRFARDLSAILGDRVSREDLLAMFSKNGARALGLND